MSNVQEMDLVPVVSVDEATDSILAEAKTALTKLDRCDRCGAEAYVRATLNSGLDLLFCGHHYNKYSLSIAPQTIYLHDERKRLTNK